MECRIAVLTCREPHKGLQYTKRELLYLSDVSIDDTSSHYNSVYHIICYHEFNLFTFHWDHYAI